MTAFLYYQDTKKREDKRSLFFCGSPCCPNGAVCESRIGAQVCKANLMRAGSARPAGGRNLKGCADKKNYSAEKLFFVDCRSL